MNTIYEKVTSFKWSGKNQKKPRQTDFKVNKMFEIENKVLPRIIANTPKWIVSLKTDEFDESDKDLTPEERTEKFTKSLMYADAIRDYLTYTFNKYELREVNKLRAKTMVRYGMGWVRVSYKYDMVHEE